MLLVSPAEPAALRALGRSSPIPERMGADFLFHARGEWYGVQRKEIGDLIASMSDGRLAKEIGQLKQCAHAMLIVEGGVKFTLDGELMGKGYGQDISKAAWRGVLWSVQAKGVHLCHTSDLADTAETLEIYQRYAAKLRHNALDRRPGPTSLWGKPDNRDYQTHLVMGLPDVGPELAARIVETFDGVPFGWNVREEELTKVQGIGKVKAKRIYQALNQMEAKGE